MNENLDLVEILKDCPKGTKLYSSIYGEVELSGVYNGAKYPILIIRSDNTCISFANDGRMSLDWSGECLLFPSKEQRDWSKFKPKQSKFDPKTLQPFDKVLVRNKDYCTWVCDLFSHIITEIQYYKYRCSSNRYEYCIPYNDDTKHLVGTAEEAPEFYRYWED